MYRVRKTWADSKSQVGAYLTLANAKKAADKYKYNVYDDKGNQVYPVVEKIIYRVRQSWANEQSQVGAYVSLENAKTACDKYPGYSVFDNNGKAIYTSKIQTSGKAQSITVSFDKYTFQNKGKTKKLGASVSSGLPLTYVSSNPKVVTIDKNGLITAVAAGTATITVKQIGNSTYNSASKNITVVVPTWKTWDQITAPIYNAALAQAKHMRKYTYSWKGANKQTIADSKKYGTCVTYANCVLYRLGILKEKTYIYQDTKGAITYSGATSSLTSDCKNRAKKYLTSKRVKNVYPYKMKNTLKRGDILMYTTGTIKAGGGNHICIFSGKWSGNNAIVWDNNWARKNGASNAYFNKPLDSYTRIKHFNVYTECTNGTITTSNTYLAAQSVKVSYSPISGKKLKSVTVDGKAVDIKKYPSSYTFSNLAASHTIIVTYA